MFFYSIYNDNHKKLNIMKSGFLLNFEPLTKEPTYELSSSLYEFWDCLFPIVKQDISYDFFDVVNHYYVYSTDDFKVEGNSYHLFFGQAAGLCTMSADISLHWTELILGLNQKQFEKFFKSMDWKLVGGITSVKELKANQKEFFFYHEATESIHGIYEYEGKYVISSDEGKELNFEELSEEDQKTYSNLVKTKTCRCPICKSIEAKSYTKHQIPKVSLPVDTVDFGSYNLAKKHKNKVKTIFLYESYKLVLGAELKGFTKLNRLTISYSSLSYLPDELCEVATLETLDLHSNNLKEIPQDINRLTHLKTLILSRNPITSLPKSIGELKNLKILDLTSCDDLKTFPKEIQYLESLEELHLNYNEQLGPSLKSFPFEKLKNLRELNLSRVSLVEIPQGIFKLKHLESLNFGQNEIASKQLPLEIAQLSKLKNLWLESCNLHIINDELFQLKKLTILNLDGNSIQIIPNSIQNLTKLETLRCSDNLIETIPATLCKLTKLDRLDLSYTPLKELPKEIVDFKSLFLDLTETEFSKYVKECEQIENLENIVLCV